MKIIKSPVQQIGFWMLRFDFKINPSEKEEKSSELFPKYEVDLDFGKKEKDGLILVYTKVSVNQGENSLPGYSFFAEGVTRFRLNDENVKEKINTPCINISIQNLRNHIASVTADCQLGKYSFPTINLGAMLDEKKKTLAAKPVASGKTVRKRKIIK